MDDDHPHDKRHTTNNNIIYSEEEKEEDFETVQRLIDEIEVLKHVYGSTADDNHQQLGDIIHVDDGNTEHVDVDVGYDEENNDVSKGQHDDQELLDARSTLSTFVVLSPSELNEIKKILDSSEDYDGAHGCNDAGVASASRAPATRESGNSKHNSCRYIIPTIRIEIRTSIPTETITDADTEGPSRPPIAATIQICLPDGYPTRNCALVSYLRVTSTPPFTRSSIDSITTRLVERARSPELHGMEAVMDLIEHLHLFCQQEYETIQKVVTAGRDKKTATAAASAASVAACDEAAQISAEAASYSTNRPSDKSTGTDGLRCWIWVHHITNKDRRKDIVREATERQLAGFLKNGYPGVVLIEGRYDDCQSFVTWVKGNKSRPGGFGRQWGHHCRGQIVLQSFSQWRLSSSGQNSSPSLDSSNISSSRFVELEDMADLAKECKAVGLEDEFLTYVMQHK